MKKENEKVSEDLWGVDSFEEIGNPYEETKEKDWETIERKEKIPLFQAFKDQEEYVEEYNSVLNTIPKKKRYIFATFIMRLNQSVREGHYSE